MHKAWNENGARNILREPWGGSANPRISSFKQGCYPAAPHINEPTKHLISRIVAITNEGSCVPGLFPDEVSAFVFCLEGEETMVAPAEHQVPPCLASFSTLSQKLFPPGSSGDVITAQSTWEPYRKRMHPPYWIFLADIYNSLIQKRPKWWHLMTHSTLRIESAISNTDGNIDPFAIIFCTSPWIILQLLFSQQWAESWHHLYNSTAVDAEVTFLIICAFLTAHWARIEFDNSVNHMATFRKQLFSFLQNKCGKKTFYLVHCSFIQKSINKFSCCDTHVLVSTFMLGSICCVSAESISFHWVSSAFILHTETDFLLDSIIHKLQMVQNSPEARLSITSHLFVLTMKSFFSHWSPLTIWSLCISLILFHFSHSLLCIPLVWSHSKGFSKVRFSGWHLFQELEFYSRVHQKERRVKYMCADKFPKTEMRWGHIFVCLLVSPLVQYLKEEKGKSCPKSAASLPVNASIMSCVLALLPADAASRLSVCAAHIGLFWTYGCTRTHTCWCW